MEQKLKFRDALKVLAGGCKGSIDDGEGGLVGQKHLTMEKYWVATFRGTRAVTLGKKYDLSIDRC